MNLQRKTYKKRMEKKSFSSPFLLNRLYHLKVDIHINTHLERIALLREIIFRA